MLKLAEGVAQVRVVVVVPMPALGAVVSCDTTTDAVEVQPLIALVTVTL